MPLAIGVPHRRRASLVALLLVVACVAVFHPVLSADFVDWDDSVNIIENRAYRGLSWTHLRWMATSTLMGHYIPLTWLSFGVDYTLWGMDARGYHLTNLVLHTGTVLAFFAVALRLLRRAAPALSDGARLAGAAAAALFFAVHPLRAESVAWVTERRDVLSGLFFVLTILAYLAAHDASARGRRRLLLAAALLAYTAAFASKSIVMGLPVILVILDVYPLRRLDFTSLGALRRGWAVLIEKVPFFAIAATGAGIALYVVERFTSTTSLEAFPWSGRVAMIFYSMYFYVSRTIVPLALSPLYELPLTVSLREMRFLVPAVLVVIAAVLLVAYRRRFPAGLAAAMAYATVLAPISGVVHAGFQLAHDRYSYLSCLGWALLFGAGVAFLAATRDGRLRPIVRRAALAACAAWLLALGWLGFEQTRVWRDSYSLWTAAIDADPECALCHGNLAAYLVNNHDAGGGIRHAQIALDLRPDRPRPYATLGQGLLKAGKPAEAVPYFEEFLRRLPSSTDVLISLGVALMRADRPRDAVVPLQRAVALTPDKPLARVNYAAALVQLRDREGAMAQYFAALALDPMSPEARYGLGWALVQFGELDAARRDYVVLKSLDARLATRLASDIAGATRTP